MTFSEAQNLHWLMSMNPDLFPCYQWHQTIMFLSKACLLTKLMLVLDTYITNKQICKEYNQVAMA